MSDFRSPRRPGGGRARPRGTSRRTPGPELLTLDDDPEVAPSLVDDALRERFGGLAELWPHWEERRVILEDRDLLVVDKPSGVSTHAPEHGV
jgi:23S rRNA-/tRNA-specific pseudouridylate synthase